MAIFDSDSALAGVTTDLDIGAVEDFKALFIGIDIC